MNLPIYIDIDGTLTDNNLHRQGAPELKRIQRVKELIAAGNDVVLWSAGGNEYAEQFAKEHGLQVIAALGKPGFCIDGNPNIRNFAIQPPTWLGAAT